MTIFDIQEKAYESAKSKGFFEREVPIPEQCALIHSEVSEVTEAWRNHEPLSWTDDTGKPQGIGPEYADVVIRVLVFAKSLDIDMTAEIERKMAYNATRPYKHGNKAG